MATAFEIRVRIEKFVQELLAEEGTLPAQPNVALFTRLEDRAIALSNAVMQEVLEQELAAHVQHSHDCPRCRAPGARKKERRRTIQSRRGEVEFNEPEFYCQRCRKSFFPTVGGAGTGAGL